MSDFLGQIGNFFSGPTGKGLSTLAGLGSAGAGLYGNISADQQRQQALNQAKANANLSPQALSNMVTQATQPLNANLVRAITGQVNANEAEQGLSQAPGLTAQAVSQGLAPYEQKNQQQALQLVMQKLGLPSTFASLIPPNTNMNQLLALLMRQNNPGQSGGANFEMTTGPTAPATDYSDTSTGDFSNLFPTNASTG